MRGTVTFLMLLVVLVAQAAAGGLAEVFSQLRLHGIRDLGQVSRAYLEPNGMISVIRHDDTGTDPPPAPKILGVLVNHCIDTPNSGDVSRSGIAALS